MTEGGVRGIEVVSNELICFSPPSLSPLSRPTLGRAPAPAEAHVDIDADIQGTHMITRRMLLSVIVAASGGLSAVLPAMSQSYPTRPITMIVPFPPGGALDTVARVLSERMRTSLGQPVIIENVSGGAGNVGVARLARAAPDGYTLDIGGWVTHVLNGAIFPLKFDVQKDFQPVCLIATQPMLIVGMKTLPFETLKELIVWLTANPEKALVGHAGVGTTGHISGLFFQTETGA